MSENSPADAEMAEKKRLAAERRKKLLDQVSLGFSTFICNLKVNALTPPYNGVDRPKSGLNYELLVSITNLPRYWARNPGPIKKYLSLGLSH